MGSLDQFETLPMPGQKTQKVGTHPIVCCPKKIYKDDFICFPTDAWCPIYKKIEYPIDDSFTRVEPPPPITMGNRTCYNTPLGDGKVLSNCVPLNQCAELGKRMEHVHWIEAFPLAMKMVMGQSQAQTCSDSCKPLVLSLATGVDPKGVWMSILVARPGQGLACVFLTHS